MNGLDISNTPLVKEWLSQGKAEGILEGMAKTLLTQGKKRFGTVPVKVRKSILATRDRAQLDAMLERILDAKSWQEVLTGKA